MFWKKNKGDVAFPSESDLRSSIVNNTRVLNLLSFIWIGFMLVYFISKDIYLLVISVLLAVFMNKHHITVKIDKARLQILSIKDEIDLNKGGNNGN